MCNPRGTGNAQNLSWGTDLFLASGIPTLRLLLPFVPFSRPLVTVQPHTRSPLLPDPPLFLPDSIAPFPASHSCSFPGLLLSLPLGASTSLLAPYPRDPTVSLNSKLPSPSLEHCSG